MTATIIFSVIILFIVFVVLLIKATNAKVIVTYDDLGLNTKGGKSYLWSELNSIGYYLLKCKYPKNADDKIQSIRYYFGNGMAILPVFKPKMDSFTTNLVEKTHTLKVRKTEKIFGYDLPK